jgi:hypothetical protein
MLRRLRPSLQRRDSSFRLSFAMNDSPQTGRRDLHEDQRARAEFVERQQSNGLSMTDAVDKAAKEFNVEPRTIYRAKKYKDAFESLPQDVRGHVRRYVNEKRINVGYVYREFVKLTEESQRATVLQWEQGDFPKKGQTIARSDNRSTPVTVPEDETDDNEAEAEPIRQSYHMQAMLAKCGETMGFKVWLPKRDRNSVLQEWQPEAGTLVDVLPLHYGNQAMATVEQIDVLWLDRHGIAHAFEVEHTTSVYSGILRMADLMALLPRLKIKLHIVAPTTRRKKVLSEITRPVFSLREPDPLSEICDYLPYDSVEQLAATPDLDCMTDAVLGKYVESADEETD